MPDFPARSQSLETERHFRIALEASPCAMVIVNRSGKIVMLNSRAEKMFGYRRDELLGQTIEILMPEASRKEHRNYRRDFFVSRAARAMAPGREVHGRRKDGSYFPIEAGLNPIETESGVYVLVSILDITERKQWASAVGEAEERFRNLAAAAPVMIWVAGPDRLCTFVNKSWLVFTGRTMDQELGNGWLENLHAGDVDRCLAAYSESFSARSPFQIEFRMRGADGEYRWVRNNGVPRFTAGAGFAGFITAAIDITEAKKLREALLARQNLDSLGALAGRVAHDFNNLLGGILAEAELAQVNIGSGSPPDEEIQRIIAVAVRGSEILRQLMTFSSTDDGTIEPADLPALIQEMLGLLKISISKNIDLRTDLGRNLPLTRVNPVQIRRAVMDLVFNASEAIGDSPGTIDIRISHIPASRLGTIGGNVNPAPCEYLALEVSGTGVMPEAVRARIFDPLFMPESPGRWLGLFSVQAIVSGYGGTLNLTSAQGRGTQFEVLLPCASQAVAPHGNGPPPAAEHSAPAALGTVLLVEDEAALRLAVSKMLRKRGFTVLEAGDGRAAMDLFRARNGDAEVILLDMTLPGMPARDVIAEAERIRPGVNVIITTAFRWETGAPAVADRHVRAFIRKPYEIDELVALLRQVLSARSAGGVA